MLMTENCSWGSTIFPNQTKQKIIEPLFSYENKSLLL